jgi:hypothetical protein
MNSIFKLTDTQNVVHDDIIEYFNFNDNNIDNKNVTKNKKDIIVHNNEYLLIGYAGTGKTTLVTNLIHYLIKSKKCKKIAIAAPTHKAVNIAKSKLYSTINEDDILTKHVQIMTIHRLLNYQSVINSNGEKVFEKSKIETLWSMYDLIIIDECSMLSDQIIDDIDIILNDKKNKNVKVLYAGDPAQLPPVNQINSKIFEKKIHTNTLENIIRTNNIKIMELSNDHRKWISNKKDTNIPQIGKYIHDKIKAFRKKHLNFWLDDYIKNFRNSGNNKGYNNSIILTWTNKKCNQYNDYIRKKIFNKENLDYYENGEILILNDFHRIIDDDYIENLDNNNDNKDNKDNNDSKDNKNNNSEKKYISFHTSEQIKIKKIKKCTYKFNKIKVKSSSNLSSKMNDIIKEKITELNSLLDEDIKVFKLTVNKISELNDADIIEKDYKIYTIHKDSEANYDKIIIQIDKIMNYIKEKTIGDLMKNNVKNKKNDKNNKNSKNNNNNNNKLNNMEICSIYSEIDKKINKIYKDIQNNIIDCFAKLNYGYCITVHKSQGSTFENVYIDLDDIFNNSKDDETMKCIYTAITRTSGTLQFLINA